ncbi:hypothetical protein J1614_008712 [Plenodomus biglobosus]|nr:hypothetical protein J1614_008712 [Plenodomus biglobosus]
MTLTETIKNAVGLSNDPPSQSCRALPHRRRRETKTLTAAMQNRGYPRGDERRPTAPCLPRFLRKSADPIEPLSVRGVLSAVEVRGSPAPWARGVNRGS